MWSVCEVVVVPYVDAVVAVTVMRVLLFVLHVCMLRECDGARLTAMLVGGGRGRGDGGYVSLCCVCSHVVVYGLSVRLSWYPM